MIDQAFMTTLGRWYQWRQMGAPLDRYSEDDIKAFKAIESVYLKMPWRFRLSIVEAARAEILGVDCWTNPRLPRDRQERLQLRDLALFMLYGYCK